MILTPLIVEFRLDFPSSFFWVKLFVNVTNIHHKKQQQQQKKQIVMLSTLKVQKQHTNPDGQDVSQ